MVLVLFVKWETFSACLSNCFYESNPTEAVGTALGLCLFGSIAGIEPTYRKRYFHFTFSPETSVRCPLKWASLMAFFLSLWGVYRIFILFTKLNRFLYLNYLTLWWCLSYFYFIYKTQLFSLLKLLNLVMMFTKLNCFLYLNYLTLWWCLSYFYFIHKTQLFAGSSCTKGETSWG
jgi:hypothetical protein